jgi:hypothetical protein
MEGSIASYSRHCERSEAIQRCVLSAVIARLDRAIQYAETLVIE